MMKAYRGSLQSIPPSINEAQNTGNIPYPTTQLRMTLKLHALNIKSHHLDFEPFGFSVFGSFGSAAQELLARVCRRYRTHARIAEWEAHAWVHRRLSFAIMRGVADQFVSRRLDSFGW